MFLHATSCLYNWPRSFTLCELERAVLLPAASNVAHHVLAALLKQRRGVPTRDKDAYALSVPAIQLIGSHKALISLYHSVSDECTLSDLCIPSDVVFLVNSMIAVSDSS